MKKKDFLLIIVLVIFAVLGFVFLKDRVDQFKKIFEINLYYAIPIFLLAVISFIFRGQKLRMLMEHHGIKVGILEYTAIQTLTQFWNYLTPFKGGMSARAIYMKKRYKFPYTSSLSLVGTSYFIDFLFFSLMGLVITLFAPIQESVRYSLLTFFVLLISGSIFVLFFFPKIHLKTNIKILKHILKSIEEFRKIRHKYSLVLKIGLNCILRVLTTSTRYFFIFYAYQYQMPFYACIIIVIFSALANLISITPMSLGFKESAVLLSTKFFQGSAVMGVIVSLIDRVFMMLWVFISAPFFSYILFRKFTFSKDRI